MQQYPSDVIQKLENQLDQLINLRSYLCKIQEWNLLKLVHSGLKTTGVILFEHHMLEANPNITKKALIKQCKKVNRFLQTELSKDFDNVPQ